MAAKNSHIVPGLKSGVVHLGRNIYNKMSKNLNGQWIA